MPEICEYATIYEQLNHLLSSRQLKSCDIIGGKWINHPIPMWSIFQSYLPHLKFVKVYHKAKLLIFKLKKNLTAINNRIEFIIDEEDSQDNKNNDSSQENNQDMKNDSSQEDKNDSSQENDSQDFLLIDMINYDEELKEKERLEKRKFNEELEKKKEAFKSEKYMYILITLGMSGNLTNVKEKHSHVRFSLTERDETDDEPKLNKDDEKVEDNYNIFYYNDVRRFGNIYLVFTERDLKNHLNKTAKPIGLTSNNIPLITEEEFITKVERQVHKPLAKQIMDQKSICSGIGNYLLSEIFYASQLNPFVKCSELTKDEISRFFIEANKVINESYKNKGLSIKDYKDAYGNSGEHSKHLKVYGRLKDNEGNKVIKKTGPHGRSIYYIKDQVEKGDSSIKDQVDSSVKNDDYVIVFE